MYLNPNENSRTLTKFESSRRKYRKILKNRFLYNAARLFYDIYCNILGPLHKFPDYLIIGSSRSGTTSLFEYLMNHPNVEYPTTKQVHYFDKYSHFNLYLGSFLFPGSEINLAAKQQLLFLAR